jgi:hypothetical protein
MTIKEGIVANLQRRSIALQTAALLGAGAVAGLTLDLAVHLHLLSGPLAAALAALVITVLGAAMWTVMVRRSDSLDAVTKKGNQASPNPRSLSSAPQPVGPTTRRFSSPRR